VTGTLLFYRAIPSIAQTMLSQDVRLFVCHSSVFSCVKTTKHALQLYSQSASYSVLFFTFLIS